MTAIAAEGRARLDIGKVISRTFWVLRRKGLPFAVALIVWNIAGAINAAMQLNRLQAVTAHPTVVQPVQIGNPVVFGLTFLFGLVIGPIVIGAIFHSTVKELDGEPADFMASCRVGARHWLGFVIVAILWALGVFFASFLLFVPGIMLAVAWAVALPAEVVEGAGPIRAFGRSLELTRGRRWSIFLLGLIVMVIVWALEVAILTVVRLTGGFAMFANPATMGVMMVLGILINLLALTLGGALYHELRQLRDGPGVRVLGEVFA